MSFRDASKVGMSKSKHSYRSDALSGFRWFVCLLKLAPHIVTKHHSDDLGGTGWCKSSDLNAWIYK